MITTILIIAALAFAAYKIIGGVRTIQDASYNDQSAKSEGRRSVTIGIVGGVALIIFALIQPFAVERVDAGHVGIKVNLTGDNRGVSKYQYKTGWVVFNSWTESLYEFPTYQQHIEFDQQQVITKGGFPADIKPSFNYSLKPNAVGDMFVNLRLPIKEVEQGWLKNAIVGAVNDVANTWEVDSVFGHRQAFESAIVNECNLRLSKWFIVSQMRSNIIPPEALQEAIIAKTKSVQQAEASKQQAIAAGADGQRKIAVARADSAETVINASAKAKAMELTQQKLTPLYVEYKKIEKWDGHNSETVLGNSSNTLVNVK
jgi:regulator of protease activity HflC (stomatin/prohibitin superfamily)